MQSLGFLCLIYCFLGASLHNLPAYDLAVSYRWCPVQKVKARVFSTGAQLQTLPFPTVKLCVSPISCPLPLFQFVTLPHLDFMITLTIADTDVFLNNCMVNGEMDFSCRCSHVGAILFSPDTFSIQTADCVSGVL